MSQLDEACDDAHQIFNKLNSQIQEQKIAICMLREAIALYYPTEFQPGFEGTENANPIERAFGIAYLASAQLDPEPEHFLGFTIDHDQNMPQAEKMLAKVKALAARLNK